MSILGECPCGIAREDCEYHKPETVVVPVSAPTTLTGCKPRKWVCFTCGKEEWCGCNGGNYRLIIAVYQ